jgi:putative chitinase
MIFTQQYIQDRTGCNKENLSKHYQSYVDTCQKYAINTTLRQAAFLANIMHETNLLRTFEENLNYSAKGLLATFPKRVNQDTANELARKPEAIANYVYGYRHGNENEGDGWKYRGRGAFQVTFKSNYELIAKALKIDCLDHPELLASAPYALMSAGFFWHTHRLNNQADMGDLLGITRIVNGGYNGYEHRKELYDKLK